MEQKDSRQTRYRGLKIAGWVVLLLLLLMGGLRLSLKTAWVQDMVKRSVLYFANPYLEGELHIGRLEGDLWKSAKLHNIRLTEAGGDTAAHVDSLLLDYSIPSYFTEAFRISRVKVNRPSVTMTRDTLGRWNLVGLVRMPEDEEQAKSEFYFEVERFDLENGRARVFPTVNDPDSSYYMNELNIEARGAYSSSGYRVQLSELRFLAKLPMLRDTVSLQSQARYEERRITLDQLILSTGESLFSSEGSFNVDNNTFEVSSLLKPLSASDLQSVSNVSLAQELEVQLSLDGKSSAFQVGMVAQAPALERLEIKAGFQWDSLLAVDQFSMELLNLDGPSLVKSDTIDWPRVERFDARFTGYMPLAEWEKGRLSGSAKGWNIAYGDHRVDTVSADLDYENSRGALKANLTREEESVDLELMLNEPANLETSPWTLGLATSNFRPDYWLGPGVPDGSLNMEADITGKGLAPGEEDWNFNVLLRESRLGDQNFKKVELEGVANKDSVSSEANLSLAQSLVTGSLHLKNYRNEPQYGFEVHSDNFKVQDIAGLQANKSDFRLHLKGEGKGVTPGNLRLNSTLSLDSSSVNGAPIHELHATLQVRDTVLTVKDAVLKSEIASGRFSARQHLTRYYDQDNRLDIDMELQHLQPLASFVNAEILKAEGTLVGAIRPSGDEELEFDGGIDLQNARYDSLIHFEGVKGTVLVDIKRTPSYDIEVAVDRPTITSVVFQDIGIRSTGDLQSDVVRGSLAFNMHSGTGAELNQEGNYVIRQDTMELTTHSIEFQTPDHQLNLVTPFNIAYYESRLSTDTLKMRTRSGTPYLEAAVPRLDSVRQQAYLRARELNMQALQEMLLNRFYIGGSFTGHLMMDKERDQMAMEAGARIQQFRYEDMKIDSIVMTSNIRDHRFEGNIKVSHTNKDILTASANLPFRMGNPRDFPAEFFEEEVEGSLRITPISLDVIDGLDDLLGFSQTEGKVRLRGELKGTAGMPGVTGFVDMTNANWSGVPIDSASAHLEYRHEAEILDLTSSVTSLGQEALDLSAGIPIQLDLREWKVNILRDSEDLNLVAETRQFDLSSLNEFLDPEYIRNLKGRLDGKLALNGTLSSPSFDGSLQLSRSSMLLPRAGTTYGEMNGTLVFADDEISLRDFSIKNGGSLQASGTLGFKGITPVNMDLKVTARNFRAADNRNYQFIVNSDARLQGDLHEPKLSGSLAFQRGFLNLEEFGEKSVEQVTLESEDGREGAEGFMLYDSLDVTMNLSVKPDFDIRNQKYADMEVGLEGSVDVVKEKKGDLQLFGTINGREGYIRTLGKRFKMEAAQMQFSGQADNPSLDMRFSHEPPQPKERIIIYYVITGTLQEPEFSYESEPQMELENMISYTLFGQPYYALESWKQVVARPQGGGGAATNLMTEALLNRVESLATQKLGVDVVQIENNQSGSGGGTSIKTGWYLNERTFLAILNNISGSTPNTTFILEYMLRKNLELILTQGSESREGIDLHWHKDY